MGAAAAKAVDEFTDGGKTQAELRLAAAEQLVLRWRPSADAGSRVWNAEAVCVNRDLLAALDDVVLLKETHAFPVAPPGRSRLDSVLGGAMSRLMEELLLLRVWDASGLQGLTSLRFAGEKRLSGSASLAFSGTTDELSLGTSYASGGSHWSRPDLVAVFVDGTFLDELDLICPESLLALHEIALRVMRAGCTAELLRAFNKAPCDVSDRLLSVLPIGRHSLEAERISFEDTEWWTMEDMIKRWILATKLVVKALGVMERQLQAKICGAFERFSNDYFMAIAKQSIFVLLRFADGFTSVHAPEKFLYVLEMYEAVSNAAAGILLLFTGGGHALAELVSRQVTVVLAKLARASRIAIGGLVANIRTGCSEAGSTTCGAGVHPLTRYVMTCVQLLARHRMALHVILAEEGQPGAPAGRVTTFTGLVAELIESLERNLEEKSALISEDAGGTASAHLFLANNVSFVLNRAADADVAPLLGDGWAARRRGQLERHAASYVEEAWAPVVACLETGKPVKALAKFNAALREAVGDQVWQEVPDPALRAALRKTVYGMVVPAYSAYVQKHSKLGKFVRYTGDDLAELLSELFQG